MGATPAADIPRASGVKKGMSVSGITVGERESEAGGGWAMGLTSTVAAWGVVPAMAGWTAADGLANKFHPALVGFVSGTKEDSCDGGLSWVVSVSDDRLSAVGVDSPCIQRVMGSATAGLTKRRVEA